MDALVRVGFVRKTHGIQGFIRFEPEVHPADWIKPGTILFVGLSAENTTLCEISEVKQTASGDWMIRIKGREIVENARPLINLAVFLAQSDFDRIEIEPETSGFSGFLLYDGNKLAGKVVGQTETPAHPVLVVLLSNEKTVMVPLVTDWIVSIQKRQRRLVMNLPEGLLTL